MTTQKSIILITVDCLRPDHLSCYGYKKKTSPCIDQIAKKGVTFRQAISNGPNTYCSFPSIMTSSYAMMNVLGKESGYPDNWVFLSEENATIAEISKNAGYSTAAFHSNPWLSSYFHYNRGFDLFEDFLTPFKGSFFLKDFRADANVIYLASQLIGLYQKLLDMHESNAHCLNHEALAWLEKQNGKRFFLWLHYMDCHVPHIPPKLSFLERIEAIKLEYKLRKRSKAAGEDYRTLVNLYDKEIEFVDQEIALLLARLKEMGISEDNAYIVITADHGEQFMEHGYVAHGLLYDEVLRVPLIMIGPEIDPNTTVKEQVSLLDIAPSIIELLDLKKVRSFCGTSLVPAIRGHCHNEVVISENLSPAVSVRTEKWKCIASINEPQRDELYDLETDAGETQDLSREEKEVTKQLRRKIAKHIQNEELRRKSRSQTEPLRKQFPIDQGQLRARLKALGY